MSMPAFWRSPIPWLIAMFVAAFVFGFVMLTAEPPETHLAPTPASSRPAPAVAAAPASAATATADASAPRIEVATSRPEAEPTFEERVDDLVSIGTETATFAAHDDHAMAAASDKVAREKFDELMRRFDDAGFRALSMLATLVDASTTETSGRKIVLRLVLRTECTRLDATANSLQERTRVDAFVQAVLDSMPMHEVATEVGAYALVQQPFLRAAHEPSVLGHLQLAAEGRFSRQVATQLLLTLWDNLQRSGERTSEELARLAILHLDHPDPSQRTAAHRQLLKDVRYRNLVVSWLRDKDDRATAYEVARLAASELAPRDAMALLRELNPVLPDMATPYLVLGHRAPNEVADGYRELLAANTHPGTRRDMVIGAGMPATPLALELAQLALENDPAVDVRVHAVMCLSARNEPDIGERAMNHALDDPAIGGDPIRVGEMVFALQNLESHGHTNAVDRLGQRLRAMRMPAQSKELLERILARSLPQGLPSGVPGGPPR